MATSNTFLSTGFLNTCLLSTLRAVGKPDLRRGLKDLLPIASSSSTRGFFLALLADGFLAAFLAILSSSSSIGLACLRPLSGTGSAGAGAEVGFGLAGAAAFFAAFCFSDASTSASDAFCCSSLAFSSNLRSTASSSAFLASVSAVLRFSIAD
jgi:hypothetical protein